MDCGLPGPSDVEFSRQGYWSGLPLPTPRGLSNPGVKSVSPALAGGFSRQEYWCGLPCSSPGIIPTQE